MQAPFDISSGENAFVVRKFLTVKIDFASAGMAQYTASPIFVSGLYSPACENILESGVAEEYNNACFCRTSADAIYYQPVSLQKLEKDHYTAQPLFWAAPRGSECSEASDAIFMADQNPCSRREFAYDTRGVLAAPFRE